MSEHILKRLRLSDVAPDEIERLRAERDDAKKDIKLMFESNQALAEEIDALLVRAEAAEAERDALLALLRSAVMQLPEHRRARFEDALKGDGDE